MKIQATKQIGLAFACAMLMTPASIFAQEADEIGSTTNPATEAAGEVPSTAGEAAEGGEEVTTGGEVVNTTPGSQAPTGGSDSEETDPALDTTVPPAAEPKIGPGGRELRTDYPGTEEALRERMETDRIKGVASGEVSSKEVYDLRVKELETRIDDLKDQVFRSKSRIVLLKETLLGNKLSGSKAIIVQKSDLGKSFKLKRLTMILNGSTIRNEMDRDGSLADKEMIEILNGSLSPGTHNLEIILEYQGSAAVFNYFEGYTTQLKKACRFTVEEGMVTILDVVSFKDGNVTKRADQAAALKCEESKTPIVEEK